MQKATLAVMAAMAVLCARNEAEAAVYKLTNVVYSPTNPTGNGYLDSSRGVYLTINDQAVANGSFDFSYANTKMTSGDFASYISFNTPNDGVPAASLNPSSFLSTGSGSFHLTFDPAGAVQSVNISFTGVADSVAFSGTGSNVFGDFSSDVPGLGACGYARGLCTFTGAFQRVAATSVPEPGSIAIVLSLLGYVGLRARRTSNDQPAA